MSPSDPGATSIYDRDVTRISGPDLDADSCAICGDARRAPLFEVDGVSSPIAACRGCGLGAFHPMLGGDEIRALYPEDYYGEPGRKFRPVLERLVRAVAARHIGFLSGGLPDGASILDVGCGRGVLFSPLADRGFRVFGVEFSEDAVRGCDPRAEVRIAEKLSDAGFASETFDQIVIWHVLEHMRDPFDTVRECARILKPGGRLVIAVPNFSSAQARWSGPDWFHLDPPRHLYHFPLEALAQLIAQSGFDVQSSHHFSLRQNPFGWIQSILNRYSGQPPGALYTMLHQQGAGRTSPIPLGTRIGMWACLIALTPPAIALSVIAAWMRTGATVHVVATRSTTRLDNPAP
jgi:2-polyprenyl-3-methyl-5-hydroxy-6-metoxy-1,4-benzoquinol methylase